MHSMCIITLLFHYPKMLIIIICMPINPHLKFDTKLLQTYTFNQFYKHFTEDKKSIAAHQFVAFPDERVQGKLTCPG